MLLIFCDKGQGGGGPTSPATFVGQFGMFTCSTVLSLRTSFAHKCEGAVAEIGQFSIRTHCFSSLLVGADVVVVVGVVVEAVDVEDGELVVGVVVVGTVPGELMVFPGAGSGSEVEFVVSLFFGAAVESTSEVCLQSLL